MDADRRDPSDAERRVITALRAVAAGEAEPPDVANELRSSGIDAVEIMLELVARGSRAGAAKRGQRNDITRFTTRDDHGPSQRRPSRVPVLLEGTLYDPEDLSRFDGQVLHTLDADDHVIAFRERATIAQLWLVKFSDFLASQSRWEALERYRHGGHTTTTPDPVPPIDWAHPGSTGSGGDLQPSTVNPQFPPYPEPDVPGSFPSSHWAEFWSDPEGGGESLRLARGMHFSDLTDVGYGFLNMSDWNDRISRVFIQGDGYVALLEHIDFKGASHTLHPGAFPQQPPYGPSRPATITYDLSKVGFDNITSSIVHW